MEELFVYSILYTMGIDCYDEYKAALDNLCINNQMDNMDIWEDTLGNPQRLDRIISSSRVEPMENRAVLAGRFGTQAKFQQLPSLMSAKQARLGISIGDDPASIFAKVVFPIPFDPNAVTISS